MPSSFAEAAAELARAAERLARPEAAFAAAAERCADATRRGIEAQGLVASGELLASVYASGSEFGVSAPYASHVDAQRPFVPVEGGTLAEPLGAEVRALLESYAQGEG